MALLAPHMVHSYVYGSVILIIASLLHGFGELLAVNLFPSINAVKGDSDSESGGSYNGKVIVQ